MTDFKLSSITFDASTLAISFPEFAIQGIKPLPFNQKERESYRLYSCLGCGKLVSICTRCDRGHQYCFDGCAISEPKRRARANQKRYSSKKMTQAKRAAYMRNYYQRKKAELALKLSVPTPPPTPITIPTPINLLGTIPCFQAYANSDDSLQYLQTYADVLYQLLQTKQVAFNPAHHSFSISHLTDSSHFLTDGGSFCLSPNAVIITSTYDINQSVLKPNLSRSGVINQPNQVCACCRTVLPQLARTDFLKTTVKPHSIRG